MFGYIGEDSTAGGGRTNRADVNKVGYLFGGEGFWLPKNRNFERSLHKFDL
jgi:hypothetical protein